jgi:hypothetical protein
MREPIDFPALMRRISAHYATTELHRHACEVRFVCSLPTRQARANYLEGDPHAAPPGHLGVRQRRGDAAVERLTADARALWATGWRAGMPHLPEGQEGDAQASAAPRGERTSMVPGVGSFQQSLGEGPLRRDGSVVSGVSA